jgi:hypothetical protein
MVLTRTTPTLGRGHIAETPWLTGQSAVGAVGEDAGQVERSSWRRPSRRHALEYAKLLDNLNDAIEALCGRLP